MLWPSGDARVGRATPVARTRTRTSADAHATECCPRSGRVAVERRLPSTPAHVGVVAAHAGHPAHIHPAVRARSDESAPTRGRLNSRSVFLAAGHATEALIAGALDHFTSLPHAAPPPRFKLFDLCMTKSCHDHCARLLLLPAGFFAFLIFERPWDSTPHAPGSGSPPRSACLVARVMQTPRVLVLGLAVWVRGGPSSHRRRASRAHPHRPPRSMTAAFSSAVRTAATRHASPAPRALALRHGW